MASRINSNGNTSAAIGDDSTATQRERRRCGGYL